MNEYSKITHRFDEGSLLRNKVNGRCVMLLRSGYGQAPDQRPLVANRLDLFLQIDNLAADVVARTLSPWVGKVADANFQESCVFASKLSDAAERNSGGVQRLTEKLTKVDPPVRDQFSRLAAAVQEAPRCGKQTRQRCDGKPNIRAEGLRNSTTAK